MTLLDDLEYEAKEVRASLQYTHKTGSLEKVLIDEVILSSWACDGIVQILKLIELIRKKDEALKSLCVWFENLSDDQDQKLASGLEEAIENWDKLDHQYWDKLDHQYFDFNRIKDALALTEELE